jgi:hypothetical protein
MGSMVIRRVFAAWLSLWFALVSVDPASLHSCPMHGAVPASAHGDAGQASHHEHGHDQFGQDAPASPSSGHACLCLGDCQTGAAAALPDVLPVVPSTVYVTVVESRVALTRELEESRRTCVLPFATAPPVVTV